MSFRICLILKRTRKRPALKFVQLAEQEPHQEHNLVSPLQTLEKRPAVDIPLQSAIAALGRARKGTSITASIRPTEMTASLSRYDIESTWELRKQQYSRLQRDILLAATSHHGPLDKFLLLWTLHERVMLHRLRLRSAVYDELFSSLIDYSEYLAQSPGASGRILVAERAWILYRYMVDSGNVPTSSAAQSVMHLFCKVSFPDPTVEARAHLLLAELDEHALAATPFTLASYFGVCDVNNSMHLAVSRLADARSRYELVPTPGMCTRIISGLIRNHQMSHAVTFVAQLGGVVIDQHLLNAALNAMRHSQDPLATFATLRSLAGSGVDPSSHTLSILIEAWHDAAMKHLIPLTQAFDEVNAPTLDMATLPTDSSTKDLEKEEMKSDESLLIRLSDGMPDRLSAHIDLMARELLFIITLQQRFLIQANVTVLNKMLSASNLLYDSHQIIPSLMPKATWGKLSWELQRLRKAMKQNNVRIFDENARKDTQYT